MPTPDCYEWPSSRKGRLDAASGAVTREWVVRYTTDVLEVKDLLLANNARYWSGLSRKSVAWDSLGAPDLWKGTVEYGVSAVPDGLKPDELSFKFGTANVHVTQSKETIYRRQLADNADPAGLGTAPNMHGAIGATIDGVQGCDILVPQLEFSYSRQRAAVDWNYIRTVRDLIGTTNDKAFFGFPRRTLLYLGCDPTSAIGTLDDGSKFLFWNLAHSFRYEENRLGLTIGDIQVPAKNGWEYVWARYVPTIDGAAVAQKPSAIYVERLYDEGNFALLEIGT